jgi:hypothetical protein
MAEANPTTQTQPDVNAQIAALTGVVTKLAEGQQALIQTLAAKPPAAAAEPAAGKRGDDAAAKPMTAADVQRVVTEALAAAQQSQAQTAQRQQYAAEKLKDLPEVYRGQLGTDPTKWAAEEQTIRGRYQADFKAAGGTTKDVGGGTTGGVKPSETVDLSKLSPVQLASMALKDSKPVAAPAQTTTAAAAG